MQIKSIKETIKPNYPTNNERKSSFIKFLFENKKITLSLALAFLINSKKIVLASGGFPVEIGEIEMIPGEQPIFPRYLGLAQWVCYAVALGFLIYKIIFNIINHKKYKELSAEEQKDFKKKHIKSAIIKILIILIIGTLLGFLSEYIY